MAHVSETFTKLQNPCKPQGESRMRYLMKLTTVAVVIMGFTNAGLAKSSSAGGLPAANERISVAEETIVLLAGELELQRVERF
jgi:hypothetical protein